MSADLPVITIDRSEGGAVADTGADRSYNPDLKGAGFRWGRSIGAWYLPRTLRPETVTAKLTRLAASLDGRAVLTVTGDDARTDEERAEQRLARDRQLVGEHEARAERLAAESERLYQSSHDAVSGIPFGQPVLAGHHSQRRHERALERSRARMDKSCDAQRDADAETAKARAAAYRVARATAAEMPIPTRDDVRKGDAITYYGTRYEAVRVNGKSVTVPAILSRPGADGIVHRGDLSWTDTVPYQRITRIERNGETVWPREVADDDGVTA